MDGPQKERLRQAITIMKKLTQDLGLPYEDTEVRAVKDQLTELVRTGEPWAGSLPLSKWGRIADIRLSQKGVFECTLRCIKQNQQKH
jgi:hypothetical protein